MNPLSWDEVRKFEDKVSENFPKYYPFFLTALRTGMRIGELIALKPSDILFSERHIEVRRNSVRGTMGTPKSGKTRKVAMSAQLDRTLKRYLTRRKREALEKGWGSPPEWLFYSEEGSQIDPCHLRNRVFNKILEKGELRKIRPHDLRHTYATLRIQAGHNIADVSRQLGHHSIRITVDTYYHWMPGEGSHEVNDLDMPAAPKRNPSATNPAEEKEKGLSVGR